jgi:chromosome segregation ATPase
VSDFVTLTDEYKAALETGLGSFADSVVVQSDVDSGRIFEYLREIRGSRVHCYILDLLTASPIVTSDSGNVKRLIDPGHLSDKRSSACNLDKLVVNLHIQPAENIVIKVIRNGIINHVDNVVLILFSY